MRPSSSLVALTLVCSFVLLSVLRWASPFRARRSPLSATKQSEMEHILVTHERIDNVVVPSSDLSFLVQNREPILEVHDDIIPVLAVFFRTGWAFLERYINSIDFPVEQLVIIQDGDEEDITKFLDVYKRGRTAPFLSIRHVINTHHTGCSGAWNTLYRMFPYHPFWLFAAFDVSYPPGQLRRFYRSVLELSQNPRVGMISTKMNFYYEDKRIHDKFTLMQWAVTRSGLLTVGLYDENIFPSYYEDDDIIYRHFLSDMSMLTVDAVVNHGLPSDKGYTGGTNRAGVASSTYRKQFSLGGFQQYYRKKWGPSMTSVNVEVFNKANALQDWKTKYCAGTGNSSGIFCRPYDSQSTDLKTWSFSPRFRLCLTSGGTDCITQYSPDNTSSQGDLVTIDKWNNKEETALFEDSYNFAMKRLKRVTHEIRKDPKFDPVLGWGKRNQGMMWDLFEPLWNCHNKERLGRIGDGGKWVCNVDRLALQPSCVVYSFGSSGQITFEEDLIERTRGLCEVHIFDPSIAEEMKGKNKSIEKSPLHIHWYSQALGDSHRVVNFDRGQREANYTVSPLSQLMVELGHEKIDVLKVDVEGSEFPIFMNSIFKLSRLPFRQLLIEFHVGDPRKVMLWFERAEKMGLRMYSKDIVQYGTCNPLCRNVEVSFLNVLYVETK